MSCHDMTCLCRESMAVVIAEMRGAPAQSPSCWGTVPVELAEVKLDGDWRGRGFGMEGEEVSVATVRSLVALSSASSSPV
jgi:hypothetical protein